jgi:hypothetical protein
MSAPTSNAAAPATAGGAAAAAPTIALPDPNTLMQAAKLAIMQDKPILLDYFADSASGKAFVGQDAETNEKMLVKSAEEFTSLIQKTFKVGKDYIIMTENSIYIASGDIKARKIHANTLREE